MLGWFRRRRSKTLSKRMIPVRFSYDAAVTNKDNERHWSAVDALSAAQANSPQVRKIVRERARYEVANNSYARGIVNTLANDMVGRGPTLQLRTGSPEADAVIEREFANWAKRIGLAAKLRTMRIAKAVDGEAVGILTENAALVGVQLDVKVVESEMLSSTQQLSAVGTEALADGIRYDAFGNPVAYHILRQHPSESFGMPQGDWIDARLVLHWYRVDRPGQLRGISEIMPALGLFAQLRRYTQAVIAAAETAADFAAVLQADAPPGEEDEVEPFLPIEIEQRAMVTLPVGWDMKQMQAQQPTSTYSEFKHEIVNEIARCLHIPYNIAAGNSSNYNYASGRLDHQMYFKALAVERSECESVVLDRILLAWLDEAVLIEGMIPRGLPPISQWQWSWMWDGREHVDPQKEAAAQAQRLANLTTTLADEYARQGQDWEQKVRQIARERALLAELGLSAGDLTGDVTDGQEEQTQEED